MQPLKINARCVVDAEGRLDHIKSALDRGLQQFGASPPHNKELVVVGSGPSVKKQIKKIRRLKQQGCMVLAIKGAHDFLIGHGIIPHAAVAVDPQPHIVNCFRRKLPEGEPARPAYLIASQVCPEVFDFLADQNVILWHLLATSSHPFLGKRLQIGGGSTSGSRGVVLGWMMGFRSFHLFGFDSCLDGQGDVKLRKITGERWGEGEQQTLQLMCCGKTFYADPAMAAQANEIQDVVKMLEGSRFKAYGKGLIQTIFADNADQGRAGYYAVSDQFGESRVLPIRPEDVDLIKRQLQAASEGVYRGRSYYPAQAA